MISAAWMYVDDCRTLLYSSLTWGCVIGLIYSVGLQGLDKDVFMKFLICRMSSPEKRIICRLFALLEPSYQLQSKHIYQGRL